MGCDRLLRDARGWLVVGVLLLAIVGCGPETAQDDDDANPLSDDDDDDASTDDDDAADDDDDTTAAGWGTVAGSVRAAGGDPIGGVLVQIGDRHGGTDFDGRFELTDVPAGERVLLHASRSGWSTSTVPVEVQDGGRAEVQVFLLPSQEDWLYDVSSPGIVETDDGVTVEFIEGTFTDGDGAEIIGAITLTTTLLNTPGSLLAAPGGMQGLDADGDLVDLESFGMVEVILEQGDEPVTFEGTAILSFPAAPAADVEDGDTIGLWSFDEEAGYWISEGQGTVVEGDFVATVTHFTWWNADLPIEQTACFEGTVQSAGGDAVSGMPLDTWGLSYLGSYSAASTDGGGFCVEVMRGGEAMVTGSTLVGDVAQAITLTLPARDIAGECGGSTCLELGVLLLSDVTADDDGDGLSEEDGDCDDLDPTIGPDEPDPFGDEVDSDCDGIDGVDADGDGVAASPGPDCDDSNPGVRPDAEEWCNSLDDDCDGEVDGGAAVDASTFYADADSDGFGDATVPQMACSAPIGFVAEASDCDDADGSIWPGAPEQCTGLDHDCDGLTLESDSIDASTYYADVDGDGWGNAAAPTVACSAPAGAVETVGDCDDVDDTVSPDAEELCNGRDDDCDGDEDEGTPSNASTFYVDADGDGWGDALLPVLACAAGPGEAVLDGDCDDTDPTTNPGAIEACSEAVDLNCDGSVAFEDEDGDGTAACEDCDDGDASRFPGAPEDCDLVDSDCDGTLADYFADTDGDDLPNCVDEDDDGDGDPDTSDCSSLDGDIAAGAPEVCDAIDQDCDGDLLETFDDFDGDGDPDCTDPDDDDDGWTDDLDCAATEPDINPGATEVCNGVDDDCDGIIDACSLAEADAIVFGETVGAQLGTGLAMGDVNGDGIGDLVAGSPGSNAGAPFGGAVHVLPGPLSGVVPLADASGHLTAVSAEDAAGKSVAACDTNGDGFDDVVVGAWAADPGGRAAAGVVYVALGPMTGTVSLQDADAIIEGDVAGDWLGWSVACAGDTDGDGNEDLLLGAYRSDLSELDAGAAFLFLGPVSGTAVASTADAVLLGESAVDYAGFAVASAGDFDGDGLDDMLVGAYVNDSVGISAGAAYVVLSPVSGDVDLATAHVRLLGAAPGDQVGKAVAGVGDLDGDGLDDVAIGSIEIGDAAGAVYVFHGGATGDVSTADADAVIDGESIGDQFGTSIAGAGDVDGDGFDDLLVGAPGSDPDGVDNGMGYLFLGPVLGARGADTAEGAYPGIFGGDHVGAMVAGGVDLDGDGTPDIALGSPNNDQVAGNNGAAFIQSGGGLAP